MAKKPVKYDPDLAAQMLELIETGLSVRQICDSDPDRFPTSGGFAQWLEAHPELAKQYARATTERAAKLAYETISIADNLEEDANSRRVRIDARKWFAAKIDPKRWGDKQVIETSGIDGEAIKSETRLIVDFSGNTGS